MNNEEKIATKQKILLAAKHEFVERGLEGARMQSIADIAEVNKAMLFYYYTSKELLYKEVLRSIFIQIFENVSTIIISEIDPQKKIEQFVDSYIKFIYENPDLPRLMLREIAGGAENIRQVIAEIKHEKNLNVQSSIITIINESIAAKQFLPVDPKQTIISLIGMCLMYFIGKPLFEVALELQDIDEKQFLEERKNSIVELLKHGILARSEHGRS